MKVDKPICARELEVIPILITKAKNAEMEVEMERARAKVKEEIHEKQCALTKDNGTALATKNTALEMANQRLMWGVLGEQWHFGECYAEVAHHQFCSAVLACQYYLSLLK